MRPETALHRKSREVFVISSLYPYPLSSDALPSLPVELGVVSLRRAVVFGYSHGGLRFWMRSLGRGFWPLHRRQHRLGGRSNRASACFQRNEQLDGCMSNGYTRHGRICGRWRQFVHRSPPLLLSQHPGNELHRDMRYLWCRDPSVTRLWTRAMEACDRGK